MWTDVIDLDDFYRSRLGQIARRAVRDEIRTVWSDVRGMTVAGLGYATPYLDPFADEAERVVAVMPAHQGVTRWPGEAPNLATLADDAELPFADLSVDRLLLVHALECSEQLRPMMREAWRVLSGSGRLLVVVPSRRGFWARYDGTPFGHGYPYSQGQLKRVMRDCMFSPTQISRALYIPPVRSRFLLHSAQTVERLGHRWFATFGGVNLIEASKQIYAATPAPARKPAQRRLVVLPGRPTAARVGSKNVSPKDPAP